MELRESGRLPNTGDLVLDMIRQTIIKVVPEGTFSIALDLHYDLVELDYVLGDTLTVLHGQMVKLVLCISDRIMQTKVHLEFQDELLIIFYPEWMEVGVVHEEEVQFKSLQGDTFEVGLHKDDFGTVLGECLRAILEVQLTLHEEDPEFVEISPIKLVQFSDFGALRGLGGVATRGFG